MYAVTAQLICAFVSASAKVFFSSQTHLLDNTNEIISFDAINCFKARDLKLIGVCKKALF